MQIALSQQPALPSHSSVAGPTTHQPAWTQETKPEINSSKSPLSEDVRTAREQRFKSFLTPNVDSPSMARVGYQISIQRSFVKPIPTHQSDLIVVATPFESQPFMAAERSAVYTDLKLNAGKILFVKPYIPNRNEISILYAGGFIKTLGGAIVNSDIASGSTPLHMGRQYLLFLTYDKPTESFNILRAWDLSDEKPILLDEMGAASRMNAALGIASRSELETRVATSLASPQSTSNP